MYISLLLHMYLSTVMNDDDKDDEDNENDDMLM
jgi:hypothetical protein